MLLTSGVRIGLTALFLLAANVPGAGRDKVSPLRRPISHFSIGKTSVLDALFWLGSDERICIGIEFSDSDLSRQVSVEVDQATIGEVLKRILGPSDAFQFSVSNNVILIRKKGVKPPAWLDHRLPEYEVPRMELIWANISLWMRLERDLNPSQRGFAGDSPGTDPIDEVGPFHERGQTIRQLLIKIAAGSRGAGWFPSTDGVRVSFPASVNRFWTFVAYSGQTAERPK